MKSPPSSLSARSSSSPPMRGMTRSLMMMDGRKAVMRCSASSPSAAESVGEAPRAHELGRARAGCGLVLDDEHALAGRCSSHGSVTWLRSRAVTAASDPSLSFLHGPALRAEGPESSTAVSRYREVYGRPWDLRTDPVTALPASPGLQLAAPPRRLAEVVLCSSVPTQLLIGALLGAGWDCPARRCRHAVAALRRSCCRWPTRCC